MDLAGIYFAMLILQEVNDMKTIRSIGFCFLAAGTFSLLTTMVNAQTDSSRSGTASSYKPLSEKCATIYRMSTPNIIFSIKGSYPQLSFPSAYLKECFVIQQTTELIDGLLPNWSTLEGVSIQVVDRSNIATLPALPPRPVNPLDDGTRLVTQQAYFRIINSEGPMGVFIPANLGGYIEMFVPPGKNELIGNPFGNTSISAIAKNFANGVATFQVPNGMGYLTSSYVNLGSVYGPDLVIANSTSFWMTADRPSTLVLSGSFPTSKLTTRSISVTGPSAVQFFMSSGIPLTSFISLTSFLSFIKPGDSIALVNETTNRLDTYYYASIGGATARWYPGIPQIKAGQGFILNSLSSSFGWTQSVRFY
jgi:hypothetical protein